MCAFYHMKGPLAFAVASALVAGFSVCRAGEEVTASAQSVSVWVADPCVKVDPEGKLLVLTPLTGYKAANAVWNAWTKTITIAAARNEVVSFQLQIEGGPQGISGVTVTPSSLASGPGAIGESAFTLYSEFYTRVRVPSMSPAQTLGMGWYPDALVPMALAGYETFAVNPGRTQAVWVDLGVPKGAAAGDYRGTVKVGAKGLTPAELAVRLTVWDFTLPAESHLRWRVGYNENLADANSVPFDRRTSEVGQDFLDLETRFYRLCREHRITPTTHYTSPLPDCEGKGDALTIDWTSYDRRFAKYLDGSAFDDRVPVNIFSLPVNPQSYEGWPSSTRYAARVDLVSFRRALELTVQHWDRMGWDVNDTFVYLADDLKENQRPVVKEHCRVVKEVDPRVHRTVDFYSRFGGDAPNVVAEFRPFVTHWEIAGDYMIRGALNGVQSRGDWVGIFQGSEPFEGGDALDNDGLSLVTWPWIAWLYKLDTLSIYDATEWNTPDIWTIPENHGWQTNSHGVLVYPGLKVGVKGVVPSIRLKEIRLGMQDYEYMWLLKEAGRGDLADAIAGGIIRVALDEASPGRYGDEYYCPGKWERDPAKWFQARSQMAKAIVQAGVPVAKPAAATETSK